MPPTAKPRADRSAAARSASALSPEHIPASIRGRGQRPARRRRLLAAPAGGPVDRASGQGRGPPAPDPSRAPGPSDLKPGAIGAGVRRRRLGCLGLFRSIPRTRAVGGRERFGLAPAGPWDRATGPAVLRSHGETPAAGGRLRSDGGEDRRRVRRAPARIGGRTVAPGGREPGDPASRTRGCGRFPARASPAPAAPDLAAMGRTIPVRAPPGWAPLRPLAARGRGPSSRRPAPPSGWDWMPIPNPILRANLDARRGSQFAERSAIATASPAPCPSCSCP